MDRTDAGVNMFFGGMHLFVGALAWLVAIAIVGVVVYFAVRFAVLHAMKAHTHWVDAGKPASTPAAPPYPPAAPPQP